MIIQRLFIALLVPISYIQLLQKYQNKLGNKALRIMPAENLHITLQFLGNIPCNHSASIIAMLDDIAATIVPFPLLFKEYCYAPPHTSPSMIWATFHASEEYIRLVKTLQHKITVIMPNITLENHRSIIPHITLARFKKLPASRLPMSSLVLPPLLVDRITLVESLLKLNGAHYTLLHTAILSN